VAEARAREWTERLAAAGVPTELTTSLQAHLWTKIVYNAALNPLGALLGLPYGALAADADGRALMDDVIDECFAVAAARGVVPLVPTAAAYRDVFYGRLVPSTVDHRSSMLQDLERGRRTEIEAINGCIWRYGREAGIPTPVNATMTRLIRFRERRRAPRARHDRDRREGARGHACPRRGGLPGRGVRRALREPDRPGGASDAERAERAARRRSGRESTRRADGVSIRRRRAPRGERQGDEPSWQIVSSTIRIHSTAYFSDTDKTRALFGGEIDLGPAFPASPTS
jgi:hypothetical protein